MKPYLDTAAAHPLPGSGGERPDSSDSYDAVILGFDGSQRSYHVAEQLNLRGPHYVLTESEPPDALKSVLGERLVARPADSAHQVISADIERGPRSVALDVSGLERAVIAQTIGALWQRPSATTVDVFYAPAKFNKAGPDWPVTMVTSSVGGAFRGNPLNAGLPAALALGLGYERYVSIGALEQLSPSVYWTFKADSFEHEYDDLVAEANRHLFELVPPVAEFVYPLEQPHIAYRRLVEVVSAVRHTHQVTLVPFGPRMFTAICCFVAGSFWGEVEVAQVTEGQQTKREQHAEGRIAAVRMELDHWVDSTAR